MNYHISSRCCHINTSNKRFIPIYCPFPPYSASCTYLWNSRSLICFLHCFYKLCPQFHLENIIVLIMSFHLSDCQNYRHVSSSFNTTHASKDPARQLFGLFNTIFALTAAFNYTFLFPGCKHFKKGYQKRLRLFYSKAFKYLILLCQKLKRRRILRRPFISTIKQQKKNCPKAVLKISVGITYFPGPSPDKYLRHMRA